MEISNPVVDVYNLFRTARLNVRYYEERVHETSLLNNAIEFVVAIAAPTSALGVLFNKSDLLNGDIIQNVWSAVAVLAAILAVLKVNLKLPQKIQKMEQALSAYRALYCDLEQITTKIKAESHYSEQCKNMMDEAQKKKRILVCNPPENKQNKKLIEKLFEEINKELPVESFFIPSERNEQ